jgi:hypothetical protein
MKEEAFMLHCRKLVLTIGTSCTVIDGAHRTELGLCDDEVCSNNHDYPLIIAH